MTAPAPDLLVPVLAAGMNPVEHVVNHAWVVTEDGWWVWSAFQSNLVLSGLILLCLGPWLAKQIGTGEADEGTGRYVTKNPFAHMIEVIAVFLRDEVVKPLLGERTDRFMPFLWTLFFFILVNNLLGLVPLLDLFTLFFTDIVKTEHRAFIGGTATQSLFVNAVLAVFAFFVINVAGVRELGVLGYLKHLTGGAPWFIWPIMVPIEILGTFVKPFALTVRLFANMTAGHILVATLFGFVGLALSADLVIGAPITLVSALGATAIYFLEIFVGFLQAFIFMFLTSVFISQLSHHDDEHDHAHEHEGAHGPAEELVPAGA